MAKKRLRIGTGIGILVIIIILLIFFIPSKPIQITKTQADPMKIIPGKYLTLYSEIKSVSDIDSVYAEIPYEGGVDRIEMEKIASKHGREIYQGQWLAHGTVNLRWYTATITALDSSGNKATADVDFQDPTVNHTWPQIKGANACLISTTQSGCPNGYSPDTRYDGKFLKYTEDTVLDEGGSVTHNHTTTTYGTTSYANEAQDRGDNEFWLAERTHTHTVSLHHVSHESMIPEYINVLLCCRDSG